jgi:hypothetical protein
VTVQEFFESEKIDLEMLDERYGESDYWNSCFDFVEERWSTEIQNLSQKQAAWLSRIQEDMIEYRIKNQPSGGMRSRF